MLDLYKKNFWGMQAFIAIFTVAVFFMCHRIVGVAGLFFFTMEVSAVIGAAWGARLRRRWRGSVL